MKVSTGYFAKAKQYSDMGYALVSIALKQPWFLPKTLRIHQYNGLAPTESILSLKNSPEEYEKRYREEVLDRIKMHDVCVRLFEIIKEENKEKIVLLCYEAPNKFCHRHIVAKWLNEKLGVLVEEVTI